MVAWRRFNDAHFWECSHQNHFLYVCKRSKKHWRLGIQPGLITIIITWIKIMIKHSAEKFIIIFAIHLVFSQSFLTYLSTFFRSFSCGTLSSAESRAMDRSMCMRVWRMHLSPAASISYRMQCDTRVNILYHSKRCQSHHAHHHLFFRFFFCSPFIFAHILNVELFQNVTNNYKINYHKISLVSALKWQPTNFAGNVIERHQAK